MRFFGFFILFYWGIISVLFAEITPAINISPKWVYVLANANSSESIELAKFYIEKREIPESNLILLKMPIKETISRKEYEDFIQNPLQKILFEKGVIKENRELSSIIHFFVLCKGTPLRIEPTIVPKKNEEENSSVSNKKIVTESLQDQASVDSELTLLAAAPNYQTKMVVLNPCFQKEVLFAGYTHNILKTARLDGASFSDAKALVENALKAEKNGLMGRGYIDMGGPYPDGEKWLKLCSSLLEKEGFPISVDTKKTLMPIISRYDAPAFYFGWYSHLVGGFFEDPNFSFPPGAIALHIHSFSATSLLDKKLWTAGLVARGVTATVGNVYEPYLGLTHQPHLFLEAFFKGMCAGDAAFYSIPALSWQGVFIGDPLYSPFKKSLMEQINDSVLGTTNLHQYAYLRAINLEKDSKKREVLIKNAQLFAPGLALFYGLQKSAPAVTAVRKMPFNLNKNRQENPGLLLEIARYLAPTLKKKEALACYEYLLNNHSVSVKERKNILLEAINLARICGDVSNQKLWLEEYSKK